MIYELEPDQKKHVQSKVKQVLSGELDSWDAPKEHYPLMALNAAIVELEGVVEVDRDTNGWAWDYWQYFSYSGKKYTLAGSGYHGGLGFRESESP